MQLRLMAWLLVMAFSNPVEGRGHYHQQVLDREWKTRKAACEQDQCRRFRQVPEEGENCVNECVSQVCYKEVYAESPLEDGEFDNQRAKAYANCIRREMREELKQRQQREKRDQEI
jgi:hypothetical protein